MGVSKADDGEEMLVLEHEDDEDTEDAEENEDVEMADESEQSHKKTLPTRQIFHKCGQCERVFPSKAKFHRHMLTHNEQKPFQCPICLSNFSHKVSLKRHVALHSDKIIRHRCPTCYKVFARKDKLAIHHQRAHRRALPETVSTTTTVLKDAPPRNIIRVHVCDVCKKAFNSAYKLNRHQATHRSLTFFSCPDCHMKFIEEEGLVTHKRRKHADIYNTGKKASGDQQSVDSSSSTAEKLQQTNETTNGADVDDGREHKCNKCYMVFRKSYDLSLHMLTHEELKQYQCIICSEAFVLKDELTAHSAAHTEEFDALENDIDEEEEDEADALTDIDELGDFEEELMNESSQLSNSNSSSSQLRTRSLRTTTATSTAADPVGPQVRKLANGKSVYECEECGKAFPSPSKLSAHKISHTGVRRHHCYVCLKLFCYKSDLNRHLRNIHNIGTGNDYGRNNLEEDEMEENAFRGGSDGQAKHRRRQQCEVCDKRFSTLAKLKHHCQFHVGLQCAVCSKVFTLKSSLRRHSIRHLEEEKSNKCSVCSSVFVTIEKLIEHQRKEHNFYRNSRKPELNETNDDVQGSSESQISEHKCEQCGESFETAFKLSLHAITHTGLDNQNVERKETIFAIGAMAAHKCNTCSMVFQTELILNRHLLNSQQCLYGNLISSIPSDSSKTASSPAQPQPPQPNLGPSRIVRTPYSIHRVYECDQCDKVCPSPSKLAAHKITHTRIKEHQCYICFNNFAYKSDLNRHMRSIHMVSPTNNGGDGGMSDDSSEGSEYEPLSKSNYKRMYQCDQCGRVFHSAALLTAHRSEHKEASSEHRCPVCSQVFTAEVTYIEHMQVEHQLTIDPSAAAVASAKATLVARIGEIKMMNGQNALENEEEATQSVYHDEDEIPEEDPFDDQSSVFVPLPPLEAIVNTSDAHSNTNAGSVTVDPQVITFNGGDFRSKPHKCGLCGKLFSSPSKLKAHQVTHSGLKKHQCQICYKSFGYKSDVRRHLRNVHQIVSNIDAYSSGSDATLTATPLQLKEEEEEGEVYQLENGHAVDEGEVVAGQQPAEQPLVQVLRPHVVLQTQPAKRQLKRPVGPKNHKCDVCGMAFPCLSKLTDHQLTHSGIKEHECPVCGRAFAKKSNLTVHLRIHKSYKNKPYQCTICNECFGGKASHDEHRRLMHSGANRFLCGTCGRVFGRKGQLEDHLISHSDAKPYQCPFCENGYKRYRHLREHLKVHAIEDEHLEVDGDASQTLTKNTSDSDSDADDGDGDDDVIELNKEDESNVGFINSSANMSNHLYTTSR